MSSHQRQLDARTVVEEIIGTQAFTLDDFQEQFFRHCIDNPPVIWEKPDLIVVLGGDNSFTSVAQLCRDVPVLAVNSDPTLSLGYLTRWRVDNFKDIGRLTVAVRSGDYYTEEWTRLECNLMPTIPAVSEYYLGETKRKDMSRHIIEYEGESYEQKCSGLIVTTGVGSTGWYNSINWHRSQDENAFSPKVSLAKFVVTEPFRFNKGNLREGIIEPGEELVVHSLNDDGGLISADSWKERDFRRGATARIKLGNPVKVLVP
jgi:hypothetical protein